MDFRFGLVAIFLILNMVSIQFTEVKLLDTVQSSIAHCTPKETKIVIVGAGSSGIAAASKLLQGGVNDFVILEANDRIGGRIYTKEFGENVVDLGAQWVHGKSGNIVYELASKYDLLNSSEILDDFSKHEFLTINGEIMISNEEISELENIYLHVMNKIEEEEFKEESESLGDFFTREYYKAFDEKNITSRARAAEYLSWIEKAQIVEDSESWFAVSAKRYKEYWMCEGGQYVDWQNRGYKTIFDVLMQKIPNAEESLPVMEKIEFEKVVTTIDYNSGENVTVITRDGCEYSALHVIFTGSLGVLKEKHSTMFVPPLPQKKQRAIEGLNIGTVNKIFFEFSHRWWSEDKVGFDFIWPENDKKEFLKTYGEDKEWLCDVYSIMIVAYQPNLLCAWIVGKNAKYIETLSDIDVFDGLYLLLNKSCEGRYNVEKPVKMLRSKWYTNEHFRGTYSFQSITSEQMHVRPRDLAEPIMSGNKSVILFAGEATHDHYYSTVHGAVETGFREADRLIECEKQFNSPVTTSSTTTPTVIRKRIDVKRAINQLIDNFDESLEIEVETNAKGMERMSVVIVGVELYSTSSFVSLMRLSSVMDFRFGLIAIFLILNVAFVRFTVQSSTTRCVPKETKIVIIGAGPSGIAAASKLLQGGVNDFVILEANDRIGGRVYTKEFGVNVVELGAQWVHGQSGNLVYELASKHDLLNSSAILADPSQHEFITIYGEIRPKEEGAEIMRIFFEIMHKIKQIEFQEENESLGDYFTREYYKIFDERNFTSRARAAEYLSLIEKMENSADGSDSWFDVSAKRFTEYWECEGDQLLSWKNGYKTIFDLLLQKIPNEEEVLPVMDKIEFEKVVTTIDYSSGENVTVITRDGCEYSALHVIFTGSLGVLKEKHSTMFVPPLPQKKQRAIEGLTIGTANKIYLEFSHKWWPDDKVSSDFIWPENDKKEFLETYGQDKEWLIDVISFINVVYQPNLLCAWIIGNNSRHMETLSDDEVLDGLNLLLEKSFEKHDQVVKPIKMLRSKWYTNEHFRGSYSFQSVTSERMDVRPKDLAEPVMSGNKPVILFAGEATHDHYYSTVHGAVETGFREADRLIEYEKQLNSPVTTSSTTTSAQ
ncbi:uncharacterized protein LOC105196041 [Solenopsis invicta]|uniref:uncharacterized protein LOC105196041 n=1 Tax=Solenopsis invicta TaxID=13686 RepID=UPI00193D9FF0|nr:uncharacterized protein LOC105196041 [Solenopsis invicta]